MHPLNPSQLYIARHMAKLFFFFKCSCGWLPLGSSWQPYGMVYVILVFKTLHFFFVFNYLIRDHTLVSKLVARRSKRKWYEILQIQCFGIDGWKYCLFPIGRVTYLLKVLRLGADWVLFWIEEWKWFICLYFLFVHCFTVYICLYYLNWYPVTC